MDGLTRDKITEAIFQAIDTINTRRSDKLIKSTESILFGDGGQLDSLGLVILIVTIEQHLKKLFDVSITLADERAMSQKYSPFRTVETLVDYICQIQQ